MAQNHKDNLSGMSIKNIIFFFYLLPGMIFLWFSFMSPKGGFEGVASSRRRARSPIYTFFIATLFWAIVILYFLEKPTKDRVFIFIEKTFDSIFALIFNVLETILS